MSKRNYMFLFVFIIMVLFPKAGFSTIHAEATNLIDSEVNLDTSSISLDGDWYMFQEQLLSPEQIKQRLDRFEGKVVTIPNSFDTHFDKVNSFATYTKRIDIPEEYIGRTFGIHVPFQYSAYRLYVDEKLVARNGTVGTNSEEHRAEMGPDTGYFVVNSPTVYVTMQVSSFDHIRGGFENSITFGLASVINKEFYRTVTWTLFLNGSIFITGLFMFILSIYRREEKAYFIFGLFAMLISVRSLFAVPFIYTLMFLNIDWVWGTRLEYILTLLTSALYVVFLWKFHEKYFNKNVMYFIVCVHAVLVFVTLFTQPILFQDLYFKGMLFSIPYFSYVLYVIIISIKNQLTYAKLNVVGIIIIFIGFFNDYAVGQNLYQFYNLMLPAVMLYILIHVYIMGRDFAKYKNDTLLLNEQLLTLNASLDRKVYKRTKELEKANAQLARLAYIDGLTKVPNRHALNKQIEKMKLESDNRCLPISVMMFDVDYFKQYNDHYGHIAGDEVLRKVTQVMESALPNDCFFARYGGEEFVIILKNASLDRAILLAEKVRKKIEREQIAHVKSEYEILTISVGVTTSTAPLEETDVNVLIQEADELLYVSKRNGRNQVVY